MLFTVLPLLVVFGYIGSLLSRVITIQSGRALGALLLFVPLFGFSIAVERWEGIRPIAIWGFVAVVACPIGAGMGLCAWRRRAH